jgi:hypothetical protein
MIHLLYFALLIMLSSCSHAGSINCNQEQQIRAERASETSHDWDSLRRAYRQFKNCDDGGTAEGFSETVMKLLAEKWETTPRLFALIAHDKGFREFVLNHINATGDPSDIEKLKNNAQYHCPDPKNEMCQLIILRAKLAIEDMN